MQPYTDQFYRTLQEGARKSAREIVPLVLELTQPQSVIDIGCGVGSWLSVFRAYGVEDICGVDGAYLDQTLLEIPAERFLSCDLTQPFSVERRYDLVVSLEVAEHLPADGARVFIESLTRLGSLVLFSAAIPFQGGTEHINEQWPEYWAEHFQEKGYVAIDCLRRKIWRNENVEWWYAQNILMFVAQEVLENYPVLKKEYEFAGSSQLSIVHPKDIWNGLNGACASMKALRLLAISTASHLMTEQKLIFVEPL